MIGYREKAEFLFFSAGLFLSVRGYREKDEDTFFLAGFLSGTLWTGILVSNCFGKGKKGHLLYNTKKQCAHTAPIDNVPLDSH